MDIDDELKVLRRRIAELIDALDRMPKGENSGQPCVVAKTAEKGTYPTSANVFYACKPVSIGGPEVEGGSPIITTSSKFIYALHIGTVKPPVNSLVVLNGQNGRWSFVYSGCEA